MKKMNLFEVNVNPSDLQDMDIMVNDELFEAMGITLEQVRDKISDESLENLSLFICDLYDSIRKSLKENE